MLGLMTTQPDLSPRQLKEVKARTLVIVGENDMIKDSHSVLICESLPNARLVRIKGDHFIAAKNPEEFNRSDIDVAGDELSMSQAAQTLSRVLGKSVVYEAVSHKEAVRRGLLEGTVYGQEWMEAVTPGFGFDINETRQYGVPLTNLETWAATHREKIFIR